MTAQRASEDALDVTAGVEQQFEVDTGVDPHLVEHGYDVLGRHIARGAGRHRAPAQLAEARLEAADSRVEGGEHVRQPLPPGVVEVRGELDTRKHFLRLGEELAHLPRVRHARRVAEPDLVAPASAMRLARANTRSRGTGPSYGQPKATAMTASQCSPASRTAGIISSSSAMVWSIARLTLRLLCVSEADTKSPTSWNRSRTRSAFSRPRRLGTSTLRLTSSGTWIRSRTSWASASCGITSARTKLVTSSRSRPVAASASTRRTLSSVAIRSGFVLEAVARADLPDADGVAHPSFSATICV